MSSGQRNAPPLARKTTMRPPVPRPLHSRAMSATPTLTGRVSPADSATSDVSRSSRTRSPIHQAQAGMKRKERDFDHDPASGGEETNINVVVRCRGRSDREVRENSGVVVSTDGVKGKAVDLSMGPSALSNKTYNFDRVFSPAADQGMLFDEVVAPIMNEVLSGFNCTIFAYGQTGTGKTYTMSGDITDILPLPDASGIIPRVLHSLFQKLENEEMENSVKCSFIELYNEELRDLLSHDDTVKLKIFEDSNRKSHSATMVQGIEETHINTASRGIELLRVGSHKRQVAATKCNDLSSRSHTVFTITTYIKRKLETTGEDYICSGKLNLVDLAGSENIQRSGAENKRAAEAGLINKSLLTLGRVINALVDKNSHIPYRESKLTRLLQDSLGGRTKTCIIATLSPAKSNLEETISTLDYAFRAKNIRNKPQMNQTVSKRTLIREFTADIEKLKSELIATRQRNGVYLTSDAYEELTTESESRRILSEEQRDKIETMEGNLRNKAHELFTMMTNLTSLKRGNEAARLSLQNTQGVLAQTEFVLNHTKQTLSEEEVLRKAHEETEERLVDIGHGLIAMLGQTTSDIQGLHAKSRRKSDLQSLNRASWHSSQMEVGNATQLVEQRMHEFEARHQDMIHQLSERMDGFVKAESAELEESKSLLYTRTAAFEEAEHEVHSQTSKARDDMNDVLAGIETLREDVKQKVGAGLDRLSTAAERISAGVISELEGFHAQLHSSYSALGKDFKTTFDDLLKRLSSQQSEVDDLRQQLSVAGATLAQSNDWACANIDTVLAEERAQNVEDRAVLLSQISSLINASGEKQDARLDGKLADLRRDIDDSNKAYDIGQDSVNRAMDNWVEQGKVLHQDIFKSREGVKATVKQDWTAANQQTTTLQTTTRAIHSSTLTLVSDQKSSLDAQLSSLDAILARVRDQNTRHHEAHAGSLSTLGATVRGTHADLARHLTSSAARSADFASGAMAQAQDLHGALTRLDGEVLAPLAHLRDDVLAAHLAEYEPTGATPARGAKYSYASTLPRTAEHEVLLDRLRNPPPPIEEERAREEGSDVEEEPDLKDPPRRPASPTKGLVFQDEDAVAIGEAKSSSPVAVRGAAAASSSSLPSSSRAGLREVDANAVSSSASAGESRTVPLNLDKMMPPPPPQQSSASADKRAGVALADARELSASVGAGSKLPTVVRKVLAEGRENMPPPPFSATSTGVDGMGRAGRALRGRERGG